METKLIKNLAALPYEQRYASSEKEKVYEIERERESMGNKKRIKFMMMCVETKLALKSLF